MRLPRVNNCCCGLTNLKNGSLICGILSLFNSGAYGYILNEIENEQTLKSFYGFLIFLSSVGAIAVIIGALMNRPNFGKLYVAASALAFILGIVGIIWLFSIDSSKTGRLGSAFFPMCWAAYFIIVVNSWSDFI